MKTFKEYLSEDILDSKKNAVNNGDYLHNPHTGDVAVFKNKKLHYSDGSKVDHKRAGISSWWHKIDKDEYDKRSLDLDKKYEQDKEFKKVFTLK